MDQYNRRVSLHAKVNKVANRYICFDVLLTVHLSIFILVIIQLDAQNLFNNKFISCFYMFRATCAHRQEVKIVLYSLWYHHTFKQSLCIKLDNYYDKYTFVSRSVTLKFYFVFLIQTNFMYEYCKFPF